MKKLIRPKYALGFSLGILALIFFIALFLSLQVFSTPVHGLNQNQHVYIGMSLVSFAVVLMVVIMWEEILFPIKIKELSHGFVFRNRRKKLKVQALIYCIIPAIFIFVYLEFDINLLRFILWAAFCIIPPVGEKLISGINNYNDFLTMTDKKIAYKNNKKEGHYDLDKIVQLVIMNDAQGILKNIQLLFKNTTTVTIDLNEMELSDFYEYISDFIKTHYKDFYIEKSEAL